MKQEEIDTLWFKALDESVKQGELYTRYHFAALVAAAEREACAKVCEEMTAAWAEWQYNGACIDCANAIRARGDE